MNMTEHYNKADAVRYALMTVPNPEVADIKRLRTIAQAKVDQLGLKLKITTGNVSVVQHKLRRKSPTGKITTSQVEAWIESIRDKRAQNGTTGTKKKSVTAKKPVIVKSAAQATVAPKTESVPTLARLVCAREFARSCGGIDNALSDLNTLKGLML